MTAGPVVGLTEPVDVIFTSSAAPDLTVEVRTGAVVAVVIVVSAWATVERQAYDRVGVWSPEPITRRSARSAALGKFQGAVSRACDFGRKKRGAARREAL